MKKIFNKICCWFGFHEWRTREVFNSPKICERYCIYCGYSPTWER